MYDGQSGSGILEKGAGLGRKVKNGEEDGDWRQGFGILEKNIYKRRKEISVFENGAARSINFAPNQARISYKRFKNQSEDLSENQLENNSKIQEKWKV